MENTATDGKRYRTMFYNLDAILSVGYRVNSVYATQLIGASLKDAGKKLFAFTQISAELIKELKAKL